MPDFGLMPDFIPLLNEKLLTIPISFNLEIDKRAESKKKLTEIQSHSKLKTIDENMNDKENRHKQNTIPHSPLLLTKKRAAMRGDFNVNNIS